MVCLRSSSLPAAYRLAPALLTLAAFVAIPGEADACSPDICYDAGRWSELVAGNPQAVPTDGVFVLTGSRYFVDGDASDTFEALTVDVSVDGMPVEGALEAVGLGETMIWRPAAPLIAGASYVVQVAVDNGAIAPGLEGECGPDLLEVSLDFAVGAGPAGPLVAPTFEATESYGVSDIISLDTLVCCDGAFPSSEETCGWEDIYWMTGECAPTQRRGRVSATWSGDAPTPEFAGMLAYRLKVDGEAAGYRYGAPAGHSAEAAFCGNIEVVSLADGSSAASPEVCFGDSPPDPLGLHEVDPLLELGACAEGAYTCSIVPGDFGEEWDPDACQAWPDSGGTAGESESGTTGESESGTAGESGDTSSSDSSGDDSSGKTSSATAGEDDPPEGGCACAVAPGDPGLGLGLGLLALLGLRRRGD